MGGTTRLAIWGTQIGVESAESRLSVHRQRYRVLSGPDAGATFELEGPRVVIGTATICDIALRDDSVSRQHCEVCVSDGKLVVRDLDSTNGTRLDGVSVMEAVLERGSRLRLGDTELSFEVEVEWIALGESAAEHFGQLSGRSAAARSVFGILERIAPTSLTCLLTGETGVGKELAARAIHDHSHQRSGPFVVVDCGAVHADLIEAELFGHVRGAFTGADTSRSGAFEQAHGGTVFLDEIGELPHSLQPKLLRVLERREVKRLGSAQLREVDVRIVAATHRDLRLMVHDGGFREDLFFRLAEVVVSLPALRERPDDIPLLVASVLSGLTEQTRVRAVSESALAFLRNQFWAGNVRELRNVVRRAAVLADADILDVAAFEGIVGAAARPAASPKAGTEGNIDLGEKLPIKEARERWTASLEPQYLARVVELFDGDLSAVAVHIGMRRKSLYRLLRRHGMGDLVDAVG